MCSCSCPWVQSQRVGDTSLYSRLYMPEQASPYYVQASVINVGEGLTVQFVASS